MDKLTTREAMFYHIDAEGVAHCELCPNDCRIKVGESGRCRSRANIDGKLMVANYAKTIGVALDPIEKKPLYHFKPGSRIVSLGANSCNLDCFFCQNFVSSQEECLTRLIPPLDLLDLVNESGSRQVAFTYTEPFTWYEYIYDFAMLDSEVDIILVTNGYVNPQPLKQLLPYIKAMNIDLKSSRNAFYRQHCHGALEPVKYTIRNAYASGVHIEITNLIIPELNDSDDQIRELAVYIASVDRSIPLHESAYHPAYKSTIEATPADTIIRGCNIAAEYLDYVYAGNLNLGSFKDTLCPQCHAVCVSRSGFGVVSKIGDGGICPSCGNRIRGVF
ncbi:MAG: AmmeMemoRadiSam system radical SAM enzyme [Candidatus Cloacimonadaceae bacterium]|nr:AmmeMemoRadiSam system radical SAM enzyme [Candidatus Cloacimonadaceae bacterium]MDP3114641.1 AmmeMemoRadiSam system radical SAM enzyme [Candidatus Cloacimonadaceae bacterium]